MVTVVVVDEVVVVVEVDVLVVLDDAHTSTPELNYGGQVAGPIFARVAEKAARYLDLEPHEELGKGVIAGRVALTDAARR